MMGCKFAHGWKEHDYHMLVYKTRQCKQGAKCLYQGSDCPFYHSDQDRRFKNDIQNALALVEKDLDGHGSTEASQDEDEQLHFVHAERRLSANQDFHNYRQDLRDSLKILDEIIRDN
jgi:hypothetical protein